MFKLLVEHPNGNQQIIDIDATGSFFDPTKVIWDERVDGPLPAVTLGKMQRVNKQLITLSDYSEDHNQYMQSVNQEIINGKIAELWAAADAYINRTINGVALSMLALGVHQQKPKAIAVAAWCDSIWAEYYARKALITVESITNLEFSEFGDKPHTVLELREEVAATWINQP